jgi:hypothetical protein
MKRFDLRTGRAARIPRAAAIAAAVALSVPVSAACAFASSHEHSLNVTRADGDLTSCDQVHARFGDGDDPMPMAKAEQTFTLPRASTPVLQMHLDDSGGIAVSGWEKDDYQVIACKMAAASTDAQASERLKEIDVAFDGGRLSLSGPGEDWLVYFLVKAPKKAVLDLAAKNSPIGLRDIEGKITASTENGPIALVSCRGDIQVDAENGPVSIKAGGGRQRLAVKNGPLDVRLEGKRWEGDSLEASARNGPVHVDIPDGYESGVRLDVSKNSPLRCRSCEGDAGTTAGSVRTLEFGRSAPVVRISAQNGPVDVKGGQVRTTGSI